MAVKAPGESELLVETGNFQLTVGDHGVEDVPRHERLLRLVEVQPIWRQNPHGPNEKGFPIREASLSHFWVFILGHRQQLVENRNSVPEALGIGTVGPVGTEPAVVAGVGAGPGLRQICFVARNPGTKLLGRVTNVPEVAHIASDGIDAMRRLASERLVDVVDGGIFVLLEEGHLLGAEAAVVEAAVEASCADVGQVLRWWVAVKLWSRRRDLECLRNTFVGVAKGIGRAVALRWASRRAIPRTTPGEVAVLAELLSFGPKETAV